MDVEVKREREHVMSLDGNSIMIGHSLGPAFILNVLQLNDVKIKAAFFVAPFVGDLGIEEFDSVNKSFTKDKFDYAKIKSKCGRFYVYCSDNDPYVPMSKSSYLSEKLDAKFTVIKNGEHLNAGSGYFKFPLLLDDIKKELGL